MKAYGWKQAEKQIAEAIKPATAQQRKIAALAGISIARGTPRIVAAAQIRLALANELHLKVFGPARDYSFEIINVLSSGHKSPAPPKTHEEANAWIEHFYLVKRRTALSSLRPEPSDIVVTQDGSYAEISSIGLNGRLYFKGGHGSGAWPDNVEIAARQSDTSSAANEVRRKAQNNAASLRPASAWSLARHQDIQEFHVSGRPTPNDLLALEAVISKAKDERPVQKFLEKNPVLLMTLVQRSTCYVVPQKRLGCQYVPDFIIGDVDSAGIHWHLIELESPSASMFTGNGKAFGMQTRKGIDQIADWREWLQSNVAYARTRLSENGLGLFDIRADAPGLVLVGRRSTLSNKTEALRNQQSAANIQDHSYDWLIETIRGSMDFSGPAALNPFTFERD